MRCSRNSSDATSSDLDAYKRGGTLSQTSDPFAGGLVSALAAAGACLASIGFAIRRRRTTTEG